MLVKVMATTGILFLLTIAVVCGFCHVKRREKTLKELYQWLQDLAVYLILVSAILQALPQESYQKYIRFFSGLVLIILLMTPLLRLTDMEDSFRSRVQEQNMEQESASFLEEIREKQEEGKGEMTLETEEKEQIEVEEIQIGE